MIRKLILAYAAAFTAVMSYALPQPAVWFKADTGVTVENGKVVKWANQGTLGSEQDLTSGHEASPSATAITVAQHANMGTVIRFDGTDFLQSGTLSKFGISNEATIICVVDHDVGSINDRQSLWSAKTDSTSSNDRDYLCMTYYLTYVVDLAGGSGWRDSQVKFGEKVFAGIGHVVSVVAVPGTGYGYNRGGYADDSSLSASKKGIVNLDDGYLRIGRSPALANNEGVYRGDFAEFRLYNKALTAAERFQIECELAAKYNLDINPVQVSVATDADLIPRAVFAGCATEPCAFGDAPKGGKTVPEIAASGTSGPLTVSLGTTPTAEENSLVYLANNGATGLDTVWCVAAAPGARNKALKFSFESSAVYASAVGLKFCSRSSSSAAWTPVEGAVLTKTASTYEVTLAAGWTSAQYALVGKAPAVWFKADTGVTVENGKVVKWANLGSLGSEQDLSPAGEAGASATAVTLADHANMGKVVRFDGTDFLTANVASKYGITTEMTAIMVVSHDKQTSDKTRPGIWCSKPETDTSEANDYMGCIYYTEYVVNMSMDTNWRSHQVKFGKTLDRATGQVVSIVYFPNTGYGYNRGGYSDEGSLIAAKGGVGNQLQNGYLRLGNDTGRANNVIKYAGDFAEFRLYNKALTAAERFQVECELAAKYNLDINPVQVNSATDADLIPRTVFAGCATEPCAFGDAPKGGKAVSEIAATGTSGPLTVSLGTAPTAEENSLVYLANNGATGLDTVWCVAAAPGARAKPLNLSFDSAVSPDEKHLVLYGNSNGRWSRIPVEVTQSADKFVCTLPAGWTSEKLSLRVRRGLFIVVQ